MPSYSIKDLERLTGIKAHTIRIWEQRYNLLNPDRTDTNIRNYTNEELKYLLNVSLLNKYGIKISKIAEMPSAEIAKEAAAILTSHHDHEDLIGALINSMIDLDESLFHTAMDKAFSAHGFQEMVLQVVYPFLHRIGIMWQTGTINPAQEHFVSNLVRQKFIVAIDSCKPNVKNDKALSNTYLLFLPENELHELALLFYHYMVKASGSKSLYLGQSVPYEDLKRIVSISKANRFITCLTTPNEEPALTYLQKLSNDFPEAEIFAFGARVEQESISTFRNVLIPQNPQDLINLMSL